MHITKKKIGFNEYKNKYLGLIKTPAPPSPTISTGYYLTCFRQYLNNDDTVGMVNVVLITTNNSVPYSFQLEPFSNNCLPIFLKIK